MKESKYNNCNPPINDPKWVYNSHTDLLARFKAMGWKVPSLQKGSK